MTRAVLVVEDDRDINDVVCELLRGEAYNSRSVTTLRGARAQLATNAPDCVVLDLNLPDGTGEELLAEMTRGGPPCVLMSAARDARRVAARYGIELVRKPFEVNELFVAIARAIDGAVFPTEHGARSA